jgi:hypothetical protein
MPRLVVACVFALIVAAGCEGAAPSATPLTPIFDLDSSAAICGDDSVGVDLAIQHAIARPGYLDCITVTMREDPSGSAIWLCNPVRNLVSPMCEGSTIELRGLGMERIQATWHTASGARWSDPVQLLGRVRFL